MCTYCFSSSGHISVPCWQIIKSKRILTSTVLFPPLLTNLSETQCLSPWSNIKKLVIVLLPSTAEKVFLHVLFSSLSPPLTLPVNIVLLAKKCIAVILVFRNFWTCYTGKLRHTQIQSNSSF